MLEQEAFAPFSLGDGRQGFDTAAPSDPKDLVSSTLACPLKRHRYLQKQCAPPLATPIIVSARADELDNVWLPRNRRRRLCVKPSY